CRSPQAPERISSAAGARRETRQRRFDALIRGRSPANAPRDRAGHACGRGRCRCTRGRKAMPVAVALTGVAALLAAAALASALHTGRGATRLVYGVCLTVSIALLGVACSQLLAAADPPAGMTLPVGLPWIGAHFRIDALSAFFLLVTNLGGAGASLFA